MGGARGPSMVRLCVGLFISTSPALAAADEAKQPRRRPAAALFPTEVEGLSAVLLPGRNGLDTTIADRMRLRYQERNEAVLRLPFPTADTCVVQSDCFVSAAQGKGVHVIHRVSWSQASPSGCRLAITRQVGMAAPQVLSSTLADCQLNQVLEVARHLADRAASRPLRRPPADIAFTTASVPHLGLPHLPDLEHTSTSTKTPAELSIALETYAAEAIFIYYDEDEHPRFLRDRHQLSECELRDYAQEGVPDPIREYCDGNHWAWAFAGVPLGGLLAVASFPEMEQESVAGFVGVSTGLISAAVLGTLAAAKWKLPHDSTSYYSSERTLVKIARRANQALLDRLKLSDTEVRWLLSAVKQPVP